VTDITVDDWNWIMGVNLTGIFLCCKAVLPQMKKQHYGKIINFSSIGGLSEHPEERLTAPLKPRLSTSANASQPK